MVGVDPRGLGTCPLQFAISPKAKIVLRNLSRGKDNKMNKTATQSPALDLPLHHGALLFTLSCFNISS